MPQNAITVHSFTRDALIDTICREAVDRGEEVPEQVKYLARYAERLGARTYVVEAHYVDRHYVDEYAFYYSRMLPPPRDANDVAPRPTQFVALLLPWSGPI